MAYPPPITLLAVLAPLALLAACAPSAAPPQAVPAVYVTPVRNSSGMAERMLPASLRPRVEAEVGFRAGGRVTQRTVEIGQEVRLGQVLGRIDAADYQLAVEAALAQERAAEADAAQAASDAARFQRLVADGSVGAADAERQRARADTAAARLDQARHQVGLARNRAGYTELTAPFDGTVTAVRFEAGQIVAEGQAALSIARPGPLELQADIPEAMVAGLRNWQASARVLGSDAAASGNRTQTTPLRLREVAPGANAASRTFRVRYTPDKGQTGTGWRIGMTAELHLAQAGLAPGAELPVSALLVTGAPAAPTPAVWVVDAATGALRRTPVQLLRQTTDTVRVAGLADGAWVVSVGAQKLDAGLQVRPVQRPLVAPEPMVVAR